MIFVPFTFKDHGAWVKELIDPVFCEDTKGIVAVKDGEPIGVMLLDQWTETSVQCHIGIVNPICLRRMPYEFCNYVFNTCGRKILIGLTPADNKKAMRLNEHLGFKEVMRMKDAYKQGVDYVMYLMDKTTCKYITQINKAA